jgi:2-C-methyl-D-erythritol 2,4-cyclodiphosphate synthase
VTALLARHGGMVLNADTTVIAEAPKIGPHVPLMCERLASAMGVESDQVSVKATTNERLGSLGRKEGIAALAVVLVERS